MNKFGPSFLLAVVAIVAASPRVFAQPDPNLVIMQSLYTKIGETVGVGSNDPDVGESYLVLANPGILLDPNLDVSSASGRATLAAIVDKVLVPNWIYQTRDASTYDVYGKILDYHEAAVVVPTQAQKQQYMKACELIFTDCDQPQPGTTTTGFNTYQTDQELLATALQQAWIYQNKNKTDDLPPDIENQLEQANTNFNLLGDRVAIEAAQSTLNTYEHIDPNAYWQELRGRYFKNSVNGGPKYIFYPGYQAWLDPNLTWTSLSLSQTDLVDKITHLSP